MNLTYKIALFFHLLGATVWVGGHLLLALRYLPLALRKKEVSIIREFEHQYETIGIPALLVQILSGLWMAFWHYGLSFMSFSAPLQRVVSVKLLLLFLTFGLAIHARFFIIPRLTPEKLPLMGFHIVAVTLTGVCMLFLGLLFRMGGL